MSNKKFQSHLPTPLGGAPIIQTYRTDRCPCNCHCLISENRHQPCSPAAAIGAAAAPLAIAGAPIAAAAQIAAAPIAVAAPIAAATPLAYGNGVIAGNGILANGIGAGIRNLLGPSLMATESSLETESLLMESELDTELPDPSPMVTVFSEQVTDSELEDLVSVLERPSCNLLQIHCTTKRIKC
ncbi:hypothetical protein TNCT_541421 [Trichonephila clavata]|uniref:Uncharacterized protein n=1 Tax=Trichonephila clavata TaxID=2740835 RepID=A0A8X6FYP8_TRICU|nr:hypothetical protein TNCT_541421 [Trichonephila clavata]